MLPMQKADYWLQLMKQRTDALLASDEKLQQFLMWINHKSILVNVPYKPAAVRAFYLVLDLAFVPALVHVLDPALNPALNRALDLALDPALDRALDLALNPALDLAVDLALFPALFPAIEAAIYIACVRARVLLLDLEPELFSQALQKLKAQLPNPNREEERFRQWWQANGQAWTEQLRAVMIEHRNIGYDWQFSEEQREVLKQYYHANKLLVDCLNRSCNVTPAVRSHIEETLLLPIAEIEKHR